MSGENYEALDAALNVMVKGPTGLEPALTMAPTLAGLPPLTIADLLDHLQQASADDALRNRLRSCLVAWDYEPEADWTVGTSRNTDERRQRIYDLLGIRGDIREFIDTNLPFARLDPVIVVAEDFRRWYTPDRRRNRNYYWVLTPVTSKRSGGSIHPILRHSAKQRRWSSRD